MAIGGGAAATQVNASANNDGQDDVIQQNNNLSVQTQKSGPGSSNSNDPNLAREDRSYYTQISSAAGHINNDANSFSSAGLTVSATSSDSTEISSLSEQTKNQYNGRLDSENNVAQSVSNVTKAPQSSINHNSVDLEPIVDNANSILYAAGINNSSAFDVAALSNEAVNINSDVVSADAIMSRTSAFISAINSGFNATSSVDNDARQLPAFAALRDTSFHASNARSYANQISSVSNNLTSLSQAAVPYGSATQNSLKSAITAYGNHATDQFLTSYIGATGSLNSNLANYDASSSAIFSNASQAAHDAANQSVAAPADVSQGSLSSAINAAFLANSDDSVAGSVVTVDSLYRSTVSQMSSEDANADQILASLSQSASDSGAFPVSQYINDIASVSQSVNSLSNQAASTVSQTSMDLSLFNSMSSADTDHDYAKDFSLASSTASAQTELIHSASGLISIASFNASEAANDTGQNPQATALDNHFVSSANSTALSALSAASQAAGLGSQAASQANSELAALKMDQNNQNPSVASSQAEQDSKACQNDRQSASSASQAVSSYDGQIDRDVSVIGSLSSGIGQANDSSTTSAVNSYSADANSMSQSAVSAESAASSMVSVVNQAAYSASVNASNTVSAARNGESGSASEYAQNTHLNRQVADSAASTGSELAAQISAAQKQADSDLVQVQKITNEQQNNNANLLDPAKISTQDLANVLTNRSNNNYPGIITLRTSNVSSPRYVIDIHPGEEIHVSHADDSLLPESGENLPLQQAPDGVIYATDHQGHKITQFSHPDQALPNQDDIKTNYTVNPRMQFWYDNGDGSRTLVQNGDPGIPFQVDSNGEIINPQTISGHYDEPHDIDLNSITGGITPSTYPHFRTDTSIFKTNAQGDQIIDVVFGKGQGKANTPINDNGSYWLNQNWTIPMVARRYFTHIVYTYKGQKYDFNNYQNGFAGDQIQGIDSSLQQAKTNHKINSSLNIASNFQVPAFNQNDGTINNPTEIDVPLESNTQQNLQIPILLRDWKNRNLAINQNGAADSRSSYLSTITLYNVRYDTPNIYNINKGTINNLKQQIYSSKMSKNPNNSTKKNDPNYKNNPQNYQDYYLSSLLDNSFLVSGGHLNTISNIGGPNDPDHVESYWTDLNTANDARNIGIYTLTAADVKSLEQSDPDSSDPNESAFGNNVPYVGEKIPIFYFDHFKPGDQQKDLITIPHVHYNYRFWEPFDYKNDSSYDKEFVNPGKNGYLPSNVNSVNTNVNDAGTEDGLTDTNNGHNAHNFWTWFNQNLTDVSGNLAPDGFIARANPWYVPNSHFDVGSGENPANNWYLQFIRGQNGQGVQIHYLKGTSEGLEVSDDNPNALSSPDNKYKYVRYLGVANGYTNGNGVTQSVDQAQPGQSGQYPTVSVTYNGQTRQLPKNATILADAGGLCWYVQNDKHKQGAYEYSNHQRIHFIENANPVNYQDNSQNNYSYYLGSMNIYAQPLGYKVQFSGSGNYSSGGKVTQNNPKVGNYWMYPGFSTDNDNAYSTYTKTEPDGSVITYDAAGRPVDNSLRAYAGDLIRYNSNDNSEIQLDSNGRPQLKNRFNLIHGGNGVQTTLPLPTPYYRTNPQEDLNTQNQELRNHQLYYDRQYEDDYLDQDSISEPNGQGNFRTNLDPNGTDPEWAIDSSDPNYLIWPNGYPENHNNAAVVYLYNQEESYSNLIHFMNMDTGTSLRVHYKNGDGDSNSVINTLFHNHQFDMSSFLWNYIEGESSSFLKSDGSWKLSSPIPGGGYQNWYIIRTDAPGQPSTQHVNNTYIYIASNDYNDPNVQAVVPVTIQYVDQNGNHINPIGNDQGAHDFTTYGYLHGNYGSSLINAINNQIHKQSDASIQNNDEINQTQGGLWNYNAAGYNEIGRIAGNYQDDYSKPDDPGQDAESPLFTGTKSVVTAQGNKSIFGAYPVVTIILQKDPGQNNFQINYIDEDDPQRKSPAVKQDLDSLDGYAHGTSGVPAVNAEKQSLTGNSLSSTLSSLSNKGYQLDYYVNNAQANNASSSSADTINGFEADDNNFKDNGQTVNIYLKHRHSAINSSADFTQRINYQLENASGSSLGHDPQAYQNSLAYHYQGDFDEVTSSTSGKWTSAGQLSNVISPRSNGIYSYDGADYYADSSSVAAPSANASLESSGQSLTMSISASSNSVKNIKVSGPAASLTYTYDVVYRPAVSSSVNRQFHEEIHYVVHGNGASAPKAPGDYRHAETFANSGTYNPWTQQPISVASWSQTGSFSTVPTSSLSGYYADVSEVAAPSANVNDPNGNADHGMTFSYVVNYYPDAAPGYNPGSNTPSNHNPAKSSSSNSVPNQPAKPSSSASSSNSNRPSRPASNSNQPNSQHNRPVRPSSSNGSHSASSNSVNPVNPQRPNSVPALPKTPVAPISPSASSGSNSASSSSNRASNSASSNSNSMNSFTNNLVSSGRRTHFANHSQKHQVTNKHQNAKSKSQHRDDHTQVHHRATDHLQGRRSNRQRRSVKKNAKPQRKVQRKPLNQRHQRQTIRNHSSKRINSLKHDRQVSKIHRNKRTERSNAVQHRVIRKRNRRIDHSQQIRYRSQINDAKNNGISTAELEYLRKNNYRLYRQVLDGQASGLFNSENRWAARRSSHRYVNGIDDARSGKQMRSRNPDYVAGYRAYQQLTGGSLPQTGEGNQGPMTLAAAVMMILSFFLGTSVFVDKKRKP